MAGTKTGVLKELVSPFLREKIQSIENQYGKSSREYQSIAKQYLSDIAEEKSSEYVNTRHYFSEMSDTFEGEKVVGLERLYKKTVLIEPTTVCAAHCRWCLRGQYPINTMQKSQISHATRYIGSEKLKNDVDEVLITGGDPLMSLPLLGYTIGEISRNAPNIKIIRIGTRVPVQDPKRINDDLLEMLKRYSHLRIEIGINVCHPQEFWPETKDALYRLRHAGFVIYNQNPLLKGVNDDFETLSSLYQNLRELNVESHYLFHAIPMRGTDHHRTSLQKGLDLVSMLSSSGDFSGRNKPKYAVLSDIGKIVIYEGVVQQVGSDGELLLKSGFKLDDRLKWCPGWLLPNTVNVDPDGYMHTWYQDGSDAIPVQLN
jgi:lysine 2,3-aminomutase